ncbi:peptide ABC transporter permease [Actinomadura sp. NBRC 104412]|uniref:ABC transporter permease n=1 Tax=Actinomadura sp. NBRC 104412 TaxID=3032203 RepID=UPI0024A17F4E|nr:ABC transporter permease [Actinomadura sp. NBRC 104412]GLZ09434.1 peptide ABC transporter permease [Actinomadura sp. NBRC 104412]
MTLYVLRRLPSLALVLLVSSILIFAVLRLVPGDPAESLAGADATPEAVEAIRRELGLDRPWAAQYLAWLGAMPTFDLGRSYLIGGTIDSLVADALGNTLLLATSALLLAVLTALVLGTLWAGTRRAWLDHLLTGVNTLAIGVPTFVMGVALILLFGVIVPVLPSGGVPREGLLANPSITFQYLLMPAVCLALPVGAVLTRYVAESLRTELAQPYVVTALAAGVSRWRVLLRHALRNVLPTSLTVLGLQTGALLGGAVLVEFTFSWPGLGLLFERAITGRDYPVVQVLLMLSVAVFAVLQLLTDVAHAALDPRVRLGGSR